MLTHKIRIYPIRTQEKILWALSEKCRLFYNFALAERLENWYENKEKAEKERKYISYNNQQNDLPKMKEKYPEYKWVYSKVLQMTLKKLDANYKSFFSLRNNGYEDAQPPRFKGKKHFFTLCYNQSGFSIKEKIITFSHKHPSKEKLSFELQYPIPEGKIKQVEVFLDTQKKWFISITFEIEEPEYYDNGLYQALDLGITNLVSGVNLHGKFIQVKNLRADLYWRGKMEEIQSKRDHCKKHSKRWKNYNNKLFKIKRKCANQLKNFQHVMSKKIVENTKANTIIIGDLPVKNMARKKKNTGNSRKNKALKTLHYSLQNTGSLGRFVEFLTYKARKLGKRVMRIDESFSTKACCKCGKMKYRPLWERTIKCDCGNQMDRDINSAINIMVAFLSQKENYDFLSQLPSVTEESFLSIWDGFTTIYSPTRTRSSSGLVGSPDL